MSEQSLKKILVTLAALVALWGVSALFSGRGGGGSSEADGGVAAMLENLDAATIESVHINGPLATLTLERSAGAWTVNGYVADSVAVGRLWDALSGSEVSGVVATNPANHDRMGVSSDSAWTVELTRSEGETSSILIGKNGPTYPSTYARLQDQDVVVVVTGDLRSAVARGVVAWRDKTILRTDTAAVARVVIDGSDGSYTLERPDGVWMVDGQVAPAIAVGNLMRELNLLVATGFVEDAPPDEADPRRVTALDAAGDTLMTVLISGTESTRHARVRDSDVVFEIPSWRVDRIAPSVETLLPTGDGGG
jgi:hypothetical protein